MASDETVIVPCAADPQVETSLRCGRCDTPICPRCLVMTPVGARCRECARLRAHPVYDVQPQHYLRAAAVGLGITLVGGLVLASIPVFRLFGLVLLGWATGEAVTVAANRKRGTGLAVIAATATVLGTLGAQGLLAAGAVPASVPLDLRLVLALRVALAQLFSLWGLFLVLAVVLAVGRVR
jgi:hypothetical protein